MLSSATVWQTPSFLKTGHCTPNPQGSEMSSIRTQISIYNSCLVSTGGVGQAHGVEETHALPAQPVSGLLHQTGGTEGSPHPTPQGEGTVTRVTDANTGLNPRFLA